MSFLASKNIFVVGAKRTPFGKFGGKLMKITATDLAVHSSKAALAQAGLSAEKVDETFIGNVIGSSLDASYISRHVALKSGARICTPALTVNRLCGSGFETACLGAESIILGRNAIVLTGGAENMSQAPMVIDGISARWGTSLGNGLKAEDLLWAGLTDTYAKLPMGLTAEKLAEKYGISREECDAFGVRSQNLYQVAAAANVFNAEIAPVEVKGKKGKELVTADEHPRANATMADLEKLKPSFKPEGGVVTAGNASGICDGAASVVLASEEAAAANGLTPLVRLVSWSRVGCDPSIMGIGPVEAIKGALKVAGLTLQDMDLVEINEAFAGQFLACQKELGLDLSKANLNGGAIAVGHPLGASGARILAHLTHELGRKGLKYGIGAACIGGGQGIAVLLENVRK